MVKLCGVVYYREAAMPTPTKVMTSEELEMLREKCRVQSVSAVNQESQEGQTTLNGLLQQGYNIVHSHDTELDGARFVLFVLWKDDDPMKIGQMLYDGDQFGA